MKVIIYTALLTLLTSFAIAQSLVPIDRPEAKSPKISEAFDGKTTVRRTIDASGLVHYMIRFFHEDVISPKRPHLSEVVLSITNDEGKVITQSVLSISGVSTEPPSKKQFRMIRFSVHESLELGSVLSIGIHNPLRVYFSPYRLEVEKPKAEQDAAGNPLPDE